MARSKSLRISYSDYSYRGQDLWNLGGGVVLMGTRFYYARPDQIAKEKKVRIIHPD